MHVGNSVYLGIKELRSLLRDPIMLVLILYAFTYSIYTAATALPETLNRAPIAVVDEDQSPLSARIVGAFYPPFFIPPALIGPKAMDAGLDAGNYTFALHVPPNFQRDLLAGKSPELQLNVDATRMTQAFTGAGYIQAIVTEQIGEFIAGAPVQANGPVGLAVRARFNPELEKSWFGGVMQIVNHVTMLSIVLTGAALIREREHGTVEHLLVMPVTPAQIMLSKVWSMGLVVLVATLVSLVTIVQWLLEVPLKGSLALFALATGLHLFATTSMGIWLATLGRSMPQFGLLLMLVLLPLQMLSGGSTPRESMPDLVQWIMLAAPTTHFVIIAQGILFRGAGWLTLWPQLIALTAIGSVLFVSALVRFRRAIVTMA
ncbi:MAG: ABC transporter permease [Pseudomonadota bacterium]|nr:ABC transporter permease [Pseudomonadota bacterium]